MTVEEWSDAALKSLWNEYKLMGKTQTQLGQKYGLTQYKIGDLLKRARYKFSAVNPDFLAVGLNWKAKSSTFPTKNTKS